MTAPGEFARVERVIVKGDTMPRFQAVVGKFRGDMTLVEEIARIEADKINAAVAAHVEKAVEEDRKRRDVLWECKCSDCGLHYITKFDSGICPLCIAVRRAVEEFRERAAVEIKTKADARKCEVYGHDDRYCAYCSAYDDAVDISQQIIRALPLSPAEGETEGKA